VSQGVIELRGVAVNNLRYVDLDLPHHKLIVFCGVSGSGKTSMALDTLYAEGQRRYIESRASRRRLPSRTRTPAAQTGQPLAQRLNSTIT
jgi:excinuclease ABC subunit A